jgi:hypothetical protein
MSVTISRRRETPPAPTSRRFLAWLIAVGVVCAGIALFAASAYFPLDPAQSRIKPTNPWHFPLLVGHVLTGFVTLSIGVVQFWPWLRIRHPAAHRLIGRAYFFAGVFPAAILGVPVAAMSRLSIGSCAPLGLLCVLWFATAVAAFRAARERRFGDHHKWMIRNFALTAAAATGRIWGGVLFAALQPQLDTVYRGSEAMLGFSVGTAANWLSWTVNLLVAEWYLKRRRETRVR